MTDAAGVNRRKRIELRRQQRSNPDLEKASRTRTLKVDIGNVKKERLETGEIFRDIQQAANLYGIYDDLFGDAYFSPNVYLGIAFDYDDEYVTPVHRGKILTIPISFTLVLAFNKKSTSLYSILLEIEGV